MTRRLVAYALALPLFAQPLTTLSLSDAIQRGLKTNLSALTAANAQRDASATVLGARAQLLPDINGDVRESVQQTNLAAAGLRFGSIALIPGQPGFSFPSIVGPYNYFDVRGNATQSIVDLTKLYRYRSSKEGAKAAGWNTADSRELIVQAVTGAYMQIIAQQSRIDTVRAQISTAQTANTQAVDRNNSGLNARIDVNRTQVELQTQQQRLNALLNDLAKQKIALARLIGMPQSPGFTLTDPWPFDPLEKVAAVDEMVSLAWGNRPDIKAANARVSAAEETRRAASAENLPTLSVNADYGVIGINPAQSHGTFGVTGTLHVPIYRSGRVAADVEKARANVEQRKAELVDLKARAEQDVRNALLDVDTATAQMRLAESNKTLAADTVEQAGDRFRAGLADTLEVVQAQESQAAAEQDYIGAVYSYQLARVGLARATGSGVK